MDITEKFAIMTDRYRTAKDAIQATGASGHLSWVRHSNGQVYRASLFKVQDDDSTIFYTYVGATDKRSYEFVETMRVANHGFIVKLDKFQDMYQSIVNKYLY